MDVKKMGIYLCISLISTISFWPFLVTILGDSLSSRYIVDSQYNSIYDLKHSQYLMHNGISFINDDKYIYAYGEGIFLVLENTKTSKNGEIIVYIAKKNKGTDELIALGAEEYNNKMKIIWNETELTQSQIYIFRMLERTQYPFIVNN